MKRAYSLIALGLLTVGLSALDNSPWTLRDCIAHALENNITLKRQEIQVRQQEIQLNSARNSHLPDVSASASENFSFGRGLTADNTYSNTNTTSTGLSLGASVPVFQGLRIKNTIKYNELNLKAATADLQKAREDVSVAVAQAYVQILYNMELLDVARSQVSIDSLQVERLSAMEASGKASKVQVAQQKAALGQSRLSETQAASSLRLSLLDLSQLLELPDPEGFSIVRPEVSVDGLLLGNPEDIYAQAVVCRPSIRAEQFRLDAAEYSIKNARGAPAFPDGQRWTGDQLLHDEQPFQRPFRRPDKEQFQPVSGAEPQHPDLLRIPDPQPDPLRRTFENRPDAAVGEHP